MEYSGNTMKVLPPDCAGRLPQNAADMKKTSPDIEDYHHINAGSRPGITAQILHYFNIGNRQFQAKKDRRGASWFAA